MILPIVAYGDPVLKREAQEIEPDFQGLSQLISDMFETMYAAQGVGLAAPQIGQSIRLFVVDGSPFADDVQEGEEPDPKAVGMETFKKIFIIGTLQYITLVYHDGTLSFNENQNWWNKKFLFSCV